MGKRLKAGERRASILAVAKILFAERGYHGVAVDEIARRVGVSPAVLYQHFPSKEALYEGVLAAAAGERESYISAVLAGPEDFPSVLRRMVSLYVANVADDIDYLRIEMQSLLEGGRTAERMFENRWQSIAEYIEYSLRELASEGLIPPLQERAASLMFHGMIREALYAKCVLADPRYRELKLDNLVELLIGLFLKAVGLPAKRSDRGR